LPLGHLLLAGQVEKAVQLALTHLNKACGGNWPGIL